MKNKLLIPLFCLVFVLPVCIAVAQETESEGAAQPEKTVQAEKEPQANKTGGSAKPVQAAQIKNTVTGWIKKAIAFVSQIGALFGSKMGFRIGGTTGTAVASFAVAKLAEDRLPSWVKWLLYIFGGTMVAGSGGNITQLIMGSI